MESLALSCPHFKCRSSPTPAFMRAEIYFFLSSELWGSSGLLRFRYVPEDYLTLLLNSAIRLLPVTCRLSSTAFCIGCTQCSSELGCRHRSASIAGPKSSATNRESVYITYSGCTPRILSSVIIFPYSVECSFKPSLRFAVTFNES